MANTSLCTDVSDASELFRPNGLYLKPIAKLNVSVQLPQLKTPGKSISNWEVMEKIKHMIKPDTFLTLKIVKSTLEFIRFEGEIESKSQLQTVIARLDTKTIKLSGFPDQLKVRAAEAKCNFPTRYDWDSFFRDAKNMNEMKPGERPDTIHLKDVPCRWFANKRAVDKTQPKEYILRKVFEVMGEVRCVDIPMCDPYRKEMMCSKSVQTFTYGQDLVFEAFVQYKEYISFVKAMDTLRGMKLLYKEGDKAYTANIKVDFDRTKQLSDRSMRRRRLEREKLKLLEREREEKVRREREEEDRLRQEERESESRTSQDLRIRAPAWRTHTRNEARNSRYEDGKRASKESRNVICLSLSPSLGILGLIQFAHGPEICSPRH